jgi:hypothetical protein
VTHRTDRSAWFALTAVVLLSVPVLSSERTGLDVLITKARQENLARDPYWRRLLHYSRNLLGIYQSEIDDPSFFLSKVGRRDPGAELEATLRAFFDPPPTDPNAQPPQCRFPARWAWLKERLALDGKNPPEMSCPRFEQWRAKLDTESLTMVFAFAYMNNPASMYGHTFVRLNAKGRTSREPLLDYIVNFAADLEGDNGFLFAMKGLLGGYHGRFSTFPYYMKVQEYNNLESRDLWEYDLRFSAHSVERFIRHLWEMGNVRMPYFFFNKNCSYYLLPVMDVMEPSEKDLSRQFLMKAIPIDTVRAVIRRPGVLQGVFRRPSHASLMIERRRRLSPDEIRLAERVAKDPAAVARKDLSAFPPERQAMLLDSAYDLFRYRVGFKRDQPKEVQEIERQLLLLRNQVSLSQSKPSASLGVIPADAGIHHHGMVGPPLPPLPVSGRRQGPSAKRSAFGRSYRWTTAGDDVLESSPPSDAVGGPLMGPLPESTGDDGEAPDLGHKTGRIGLSYGFSNRSHFEELSLRPAVHDQDDPPVGFLPGSKLEMCHLRLRYDNDRTTLYVQDFSLVDLVSLTPWDRWIHPPSWKVNTGLRVANDLDRDPENSLYYGLNLGSGYSASIPGWRKGLLYAMAELDLGLGHCFQDNIRFGGGGSVGVILPLASRWRLRFEGSHRAYATGGTSQATKLALHQSFALIKNLEARLKLERQNRYKEVLLGIDLYL